LEEQIFSFGREGKFIFHHLIKGGGEGVGSAKPMIKIRVRTTAADTDKG
jgi:hypothetical protein